MLDHGSWTEIDDDVTDSNHLVAGFSGPLSPAAASAEGAEAEPADGIAPEAPAPLTSPESNGTTTGVAEPETPAAVPTVPPSSAAEPLPADAGGAVDHAAPTPQAAPETHAGAARPEIVVIDGRTPDIDAVRAAAEARGAEVHVLDVGRDGVEQIAALLDGRSDIATLHVVSHGGDGYVTLGNTVLGGQTAGYYADALARIGAALSDDGDIHLYGCDVAASADGKEFVARLAELTGADVAASDDRTGAASEGGDWALEHEVGEVASGGLVAKAMAGTLATFTVTNTNDSGVGSLRQAIIDANAAAGADTITFDSSLSGGTITLASDLTDITESLTITGLGARNLTISGQDTHDIFNITDGAGGTFQTVSISGLTLRDGLNDGNVGGAILNQENLTVDSVYFLSNSALSRGGGLWSNAGSLSVSNSLFVGNSVTGVGGARGGGLYVATGTWTVRNSTFTQNSAEEGGGIATQGGTGTIYNSTIAANSATSYGGGLFLLAGAGPTVSLFSTIVADNTATLANPDLANAGGTTLNSTSSLIENTTGATFTTNTGNVTGTDPGLQALANNGGAVDTMAITSSSAAFDAGANPASLTTDGRGSGFARVAFGQADIGAFEVQAATTSDTSGTPGVTGPGSAIFGPSGGGLTAELPSGVNLVITTPSTTSTDATRLDLQASLDPAEDLQRSLLGTWIAALPAGTDITATSLTLTASGSSGLVEAVTIASTGGTTEALVIDATALPAGSTIELDGVSFAAVRGAVVVQDGTGASFVTGDGSAQTVAMGDGSDSVAGGGGADVVYGNAGADAVSGGNGLDTLYGGQGDDVVFGNQGSDLLLGGLGDDQLFGGLGNDMLYSLSELLDPTPFDGDFMGQDVLFGDLGDDVLFSLAPDLRMLLDDDSEIDSPFGIFVNVLYGGQGDDTLRGSLQVYGGFSDPPGVGAGAGDLLNGQGVDEADGIIGDVLHGGQGNDVIYGSEGADRLAGDRGDDTLTGGSGADEFVFAASGGTDTVTDFSGSEGDSVTVSGTTVASLLDGAAGAVLTLADGTAATFTGATAADVSAVLTVAPAADPPPGPAGLAPPADPLFGL